MQSQPKEHTNNTVPINNNDWTVKPGVDWIVKPGVMTPLYFRDDLFFVLYRRGILRSNSVRLYRLREGWLKHIFPYKKIAERRSYTLMSYEVKTYTIEMLQDFAYDQQIPKRIFVECSEAFVYALTTKDLYPLIHKKNG
jgi:hypothetical protein